MAALINMYEFLISFIGGLLLGIAVVGYLYVHGRVLGISGLLAQIIQPKIVFQTPAIWFISGLFIVPFIYALYTQPQIVMSVNPLLLIIAGILVGFGTRLGSGCTSGHGICGMSRLSKRSIVATLTFMFFGGLTVFITRHVLGF